MLIFCSTIDHDFLMTDFMLSPLYILRTRHRFQNHKEKKDCTLNIYWLTSYLKNVINTNGYISKISSNLKDYDKEQLFLKKAFFFFLLSFYTSMLVDR